MAVSPVGTATTVEDTNAAAVAFTVNKPAGAGDGHLLLALLQLSGQVNSVPAGWTLVDSITDGPVQYVYRRLLTAGDDATTSWSFGTNFAGIGSTACLAFSGVDPTTPIDTAPTKASTATTAATSVTAPSLTTTTDGVLLVSLGGQHTGTAVASSAFTEPAGFGAKLYDITNRRQAAATKTQATAGATGTVGWTSALSSRFATILVPLRPAPVSVQTFAPTSDITTAGWTVTGGSGTAASALDETTADDADLVTSPDNPAASVLEVKFAAGTDPQSGDGHSVSYRLRTQNATSHSVVVGLYQGTTLIASWTETGLTSTFQTITRTLTGAQADAITDYTDLRLRVTATAAAATILRSATFETVLASTSDLTGYNNTGASSSSANTRVLAGTAAGGGFGAVPAAYKGSYMHRASNTGFQNNLGNTGIARGRWFSPTTATDLDQALISPGQTRWCGAAFYIRAADMTGSPAAHRWTGLMRWSDFDGVSAKSLLQVVLSTSGSALRVNLEDYGSGAATGVANRTAIHTVASLPRTDGWTYIELGAYVTDDNTLGWTELWVDGVQVGSRVTGRTIKLASQAYREIQLGMGTYGLGDNSINPACEVFVDDAYLADARRGP